MTWTLPKTWNVGDVLTSPDLNTYVRDNTNMLYGDVTWTVISGFLNGAGASSPPPAYRKVGTEVNLRGQMTSTTAAGNAAFTLPPGYTPVGTVTRLAWDSTASITTWIQVGSSGNLTVGNGANHSIWLDDIDFDTI